MCCFHYAVKSIKLNVLEQTEAGFSHEPEFHIWRSQQEIVRHVHNKRKMWEHSGEGLHQHRACRRQDMMSELLHSGFVFNNSTRCRPLSPKAVESRSLSKLTSLSPSSSRLLWIVSENVPPVFPHGFTETFYTGAGRKGSGKCTQQLTQTFAFSDTAPLENVWTSRLKAAFMCDWSSFHVFSAKCTSMSNSFQLWQNK